MYGNLMMKIEACHDSAVMLSPDLATLVSTYSFATKMLPMTSYNGYHEA